MRQLVIGDIHGCIVALRTLAELVAFQPDDVVITLGDYVDKGPDSKAVLNWLVEFQGRAQLFALRGNHDILFLQARHSRKESRDWLEEGGDKTLKSYGGNSRDDLRLVPDAHWNFLESTVRYHETETHFFVHANAYHDLPLAEQPDYMLFWEKFNHPPPHQSGKIMVCGHTSQKSFEPVNLGHAICLDTRCYGGGWLTCLDVESGRLWQANEKGKTHEGHISEYLQTTT